MKLRTAAASPRYRAAGALATALLLLGLAAAQPARTQDGLQPVRIRDVIYGRKHGVVLTLDVFRPLQPTGVGVLWMVSGGWFSAHEAINPAHARVFTERGQTVFSVVHGSQPRYAIPDIVKDVERATRYVRTHARDYGVDPDRLCIAGGSAGGHLSLMQGARGRDGDPAAADPVERASSRVRAVAGFFPPTDFVHYGEMERNALVVEELKPFRAAFGVTGSESPAELDRLARELSPYYSVTREMPPTLLIHGDADRLVPLQQSQRLMARLEELGVKHRLVVKPGAAHGWPELHEDARQLAAWFAEHTR